MIACGCWVEDRLYYRIWVVFDGVNGIDIFL